MSASIVDIDLCRKIIAQHRYPLLFATVSGAHLYGFPSPDSDFDLRGAHILPAREVLGLHALKETVESEGFWPNDRGQQIEIDLVTHDIAKFFRLMLKKNGYVLEQLLSPLVIHTTTAHEELKALAPSCITRFHGYHYLGFAQTQWGLFAKERPPRIKPLLYVYRVLLTGIHLMRSGEVQANLPTLNAEYRLPYITDLIDRKSSGLEKSTLGDADLAFHETEYLRLRARLEQEMADSSLPEAASSLDAISDLLVRLRLQTC